MTDRAGPRFFSRWELVLPACLAAVAETVTLRWVGMERAAALGPQISAPPPFDLFHDLRWLAVYHRSWWMLALLVAGVVCLRSLYAAWVVQRSWPNGHPPSIWTAFKRSVVFYLAAAVLLAPWVVLLFALALTHVSYVFFVALPGALAVALVVPQGVLAQAAGHWWRWHPSRPALGWVAAAFVWLTAAGSLAAAQPIWVAASGAAVAGVLNARAAYGIVEAIVDRPETTVLRFRRRVVPLAVGVIFAVVVGGAAAGFARVTPHTDFGDAPVAIRGKGGERAVLLAGGFNSRWSPHPNIELPDGYDVWRFSYAGLDRRGRLIPYGPEHTLQPLTVSARRFAQQVRVLHGLYDAPVTIVAESEGALVARTFLLELYPSAARLVDEVVLLDMPAVVPSVYFPPAGRQGWGTASGWGLRGLSWLVRELGPLVGSVDAPFFRQLVECRSLARTIARAPSPRGIESVWFSALADAVDGRDPTPPPGTKGHVVLTTHGGNVDKAEVGSLINQELTEADPESPALLRTAMAAVAGAARPWNVPALASRLAPSSGCDMAVRR